MKNGFLIVISFLALSCSTAEQAEPEKLFKAPENFPQPLAIISPIIRLQKKVWRLEKNCFMMAFCREMAAFLVANVISKLQVLHIMGTM